MEIQDNQKFAHTFLQEYLKNGLGALSKRDVDILVLRLLIDDGKYKFPQEIFKACRELKLTETKLRNLYQDAQLKYWQYDEKLAKEKFIELVASSAMERNKEKITFIVRDPFLRQYFEEWVDKANGFTDSSFNKNLVVIHQEILKRILEGFCSENQFKEIQSRFPKELQKIKTASSFKNALDAFMIEFAKAAGKETGALSIKVIAAGLTLFLSA
ncbi:hypothetical protein WDW89_21170 [Deltaproteobacteria bacterium TL4]